MVERWMSRPINGPEEAKAMRIENTTFSEQSSSMGFKSTVSRKDIKNEVGRKFHDDHVKKLK